MQVKVKDKSSRFLGRIFFERNKPIFDGVEDADFLDFVKLAEKRGITRFIETYDDANDQFVFSEAPVNQSDPNYHLAFIKYLERNNYDVIDEHPEVDDEINLLLQKYPADENKKQLITKLSQMSYLQKSFLLDELRSS